MEDVPITITPTGKGEHVETHPAFGMCSLNRVSGNKNLFGTSIQHNNAISIVIKTGERHVADSHDFFMGHKELIRIELSGSQLSDMLTGMNVGDGVPCTIIRYNGESIPQIPDRDSFAKEAQKQFAARMRRTNEDALNLLRKAEELAAGGIPKVAERKELVSLIQQMQMELRSNLPYISECFVERTEKAVTEAKKEVESFFNAKVQAAGLQALGARAPQLQIEDLGGE